VFNDKIQHIANPKRFKYGFEVPIENNLAIGLDKIAKNDLWRDLEAKTIQLIE
jgi:hypothetical protein